MAADVLERARSADPEAIVDALKKTHLATGVMQYDGPIVFNERGDNPNAIPTLIQILGGKPVAETRLGIVRARRSRMGGGHGVRPGDPFPGDG